MVLDSIPSTATKRKKKLMKERERQRERERGKEGLYIIGPISFVMNNN
jgi:hypothetical protein